MLSFFRIELEFIARMKAGTKRNFWNIVVRPFNGLCVQLKNKIKQQQHKISILRWQEICRKFRKKKRRKYTPGLKNSRTSLFLSSYLDRLLSVRYRGSHFLKRICNEWAREVCPRSAGTIHFLTHLYIFSRRESNKNLAQTTPIIKKKRVTKQNKNFTSEDLFPFYYPSKHREEEKLFI